MFPPEEEPMDGSEDWQIIMEDSVPGEEVIGGCVEPVSSNMMVNGNSSGSNHGGCNNVSSAGLSSLPSPQLGYHQHHMNPNHHFHHPSFYRSCQTQIHYQTPRWDPRVTSSGTMNNYLGKNNNNNNNDNDNNNNHCGGGGDLSLIAAQLQQGEQQLGAVASTSTSGGHGIPQQHLIQSSSQNGGLMSNNLVFSPEQKLLNNISINNHQQQQQQEEESRRKRKMEEAAYFDRVEKRLEKHAEYLTNKVMNALEECNRRMLAMHQYFIRESMKRAENEAAWRDQVIRWVSHREAIIVSHLEKVPGQKIHLPPLNFNVMMSMSNTAGAAADAVHHQYQYQYHYQQQQQSVDISPVTESPVSGDHHVLVGVDKSSSRWAEVEVHALIEIRSLMENAFKESTGSKGELWGEIAERMKLRGLVNRTGQRCREKWENCIKYYRKYKEEEAEGNANGNGSGRKRTRHSRTDSYFRLLDEFHARHGSLPSSESGVAAGASSDNPSPS